MRSGCLALAVVMSACGGGGNPLDNPATIINTSADAGQKLSFAYYQKCVNPILLELLPIAGTAVTNTCAAGGCHDVNTGSGGALRINPRAAEVVIGATPDAESLAALRLTEMYRNFRSAQAQVVFAEPAASRLINKPLVRGVLHGGGRVFLDENDPKARTLIYWMSHPVPQGLDEFSAPAPASCAG
ncbi:hypothetical protein [Roseateles sp.]|uniref:hypothetical protein n=1 Tax=Roseateles sp. TaxID=1971397 RepID=UPI003956154C